MISGDDIRAFKPMSEIYTEQAKKVRLALDNLLYDTNEDNIREVIKVLQRGPHLTDDDIEDVVESVYETWYEEVNT